ncbi:hypothetical protein CK203_044676 [Vitis vinifera]|uniref:Retrotransposon gag domain-containing protein n=1 Tax=Vitis vinifera TaxID=29760 RepID=A0A438H9E8_VITVI|nr:hypothetical protein CK203_044676 [Vitis vinifera]
MMESYLDKLKQAFSYTKASQQKERSKEKQRKQRGKQRTAAAVFFALLEHFPKPFSTCYIPFQSSGSQESNASNRVRFGAEMRKIWPSEDNCSRLFLKVWMLCDDLDAIPWKFLAPGSYSYELLEGEVFNSKFCINPLEPISMAIERYCNLCMPYWIRDQEGRLVRIENPQDTELDICVNIMDPPPEDQNSQQGQGVGYKASYCAPPTKLPWNGETNGLKRQISNFSAKENEKFHECWERYMEAINACPHHGFDTWLLVSYFYDGMSSSMKQILETMCGGDFMSKNPEEAMDFLSYVSEVSRGWDEPNSREKGKFPSQQTQNPKAGMYMLNEDMDMKAKVATIARRVEELELKKMHEIQAISETQAHVMPCTICQSCDHVVDECLTMPAVREMLGDQVNVVGQFRPNNSASFGNTYNSSWRNHPNFSWKPRPPPYQPQGQTQAPQQTSSVEQAIVNLSKSHG